MKLSDFEIGAEFQTSTWHRWLTRISPRMQPGSCSGQNLRALHASTHDDDCS